MPRANFAVLVALVFGAGVALSGVAASLRGPDPAPSPTAAPVTVSPAPSASLAGRDVPGSDFDRLPRYPGSIRSMHEVIRDRSFRVIALEYQADAAVDDVRAFYQRVIIDHGWERADITFNHGEWSYVLVDGSTEALIEIEEFGGLVEIDLQLSEPIPSPTPPPAEPAPTPAPIAPPPPPPVPPDDDDGDDGDDGGGGDSDDGGDDATDDD
jgi:hypothetical protein